MNIAPTMQGVWLTGHGGFEKLEVRDDIPVPKPGRRDVLIHVAADRHAHKLVELDVRTLYLKDLSLLGCTVLEPNVFTNLLGHIENGDVKPLVAKTYPLKRIADAQSEFIKRNHTGKIVVSNQGLHD